ncbi:MAG: VTT domain-containing protein [Verrucomicrobiota bacterium]|nr:VTT domain-containing protein [Verrucomicrobiota bacterium]
MENTKSNSRLYLWAQNKAISTKAPLWIGVLFFLELFLLIPLDPILLFFCLQRRPNIFLYTITAAVASVLSGAMGYLVGRFLWDLMGPFVLTHLLSPAQFEKLSYHLQTYEHLAVFVGMLLPFPLKALSLLSGVFQLGFLPFALFMLLARLLRFSLIGGVSAVWGERVQPFIERHFQHILLVIGAKVAVVLLCAWLFSRG